jgi:hypothetical protein
MTTKSMLLTATLALAGIANAKSYDITLAAPTKAGSVQLATFRRKIPEVSSMLS